MVIQQFVPKNCYSEGPTFLYFALAKSSISKLLQAEGVFLPLIGLEMLQTVYFGGWGEQKNCSPATDMHNQ